MRTRKRLKKSRKIITSCADVQKPVGSDYKTCYFYLGDRVVFTPGGADRRTKPEWLAEYVGFLDRYILGVVVGYSMNKYGRISYKVRFDKPAKRISDAHGKHKLKSYPIMIENLDEA